MRFPFLLLVAAAFAMACSTSSNEMVNDASASDVHIKPGDSTRPPEDKGVTPPEEVRAGPDVDLPPGYMDFCLADGDCAEWGLACFSSGAADQDAFCSKECTANGECPEKMLCKARGEKKVCQLAAFCDLCEDDEQCGAEGRCVEDETGAKFCTYPCAKDDPNACGAGNFCNKVGLGLEDYFCYPMFGAFKGDGSHCTPCQSTDDCLKGHQCHENPYTFERYCAKVCQTKMDCPKGFGCHELVGEEFPLCTLEVDGTPKETCYTGNKDFCEPCMDDYECQSGLCYNLPVANKYFCSFPCDFDEWPQEGCPIGLFCTPNRGQSGGKACAPGTAFGCQGFLNCVAVDCPKGEKCVGGFCQPK